MPELPEVETIRKIVGKQINGSKICDVKVYNAGSLVGVDKDSFVDNLRGRTIENIDRRGKYFIFNLDIGQMVLHLRLNGQLYVTDGTTPISKYSLMTFLLTDGKMLHFDDQRKFGKVCFIPDGEEDRISGVHRLGIEPFDDGLTVGYLKKWWKHKTCSVKEALLDQDVIAGFGNLYSDDILFLCGIYPKKRCINLSDKNYEDLVKAIPDVMMRGIMVDNVSEEQYSKMRGKVFEGKVHAFMYGRAGQPCKACGTMIRSMKLGGRTCCYCPACQHTVKMIPNEVNPDVLGDVAKYIGSYIQQYGSFDSNLILCNYIDTSKSENLTWEEFVMCAYEYIMTEDAVSVSDQKFGEYRKQKSLALYNINNDSFTVGMLWIKTQKWRDQ